MTAPEPSTATKTSNGEDELPTVERRPVLPMGWRATGAAIGIKASGRYDFAAVASGHRAAVAATFTTNAFAAAPVQVSRRHMRATAPEGEGRWGWARGVESTSGSANAATGAQGEADQEEVAAAYANALGIPTDEVLCLSTGIIGVRLPLPIIQAGIAKLIPGALGTTDEAFAAASRGLMTTDSVPKASTATVELPGADGSAPVTVRVSGIAKGVGMIHPRMATMLAIVMTDAAADPQILHGLLRPIVSRTWNQLTVDGDTSTNDTVFLLANGAAGAAAITPGTPAAAAFSAAVEAVARDLARQQAADGEGATTLITCQVRGAADDIDARAIARNVCGSSLVKAAIHGADPNWGRIASAAGTARVADAALLECAGLSPEDARARSGAIPHVDPDRLRITIGGIVVYDGHPVEFDRTAASDAMRHGEALIGIEVGLGGGRGEAFGCDLTEAYVIENSEYTT